MVEINYIPQQLALVVKGGIEVLLEVFSQWRKMINEIYGFFISIFFIFLW
jgi:hypothetical protein